MLQAYSDLHLVTDGKSIYLEDQQERIIDILKNARQPMFLVCVSDQARRLSESERKPARMEAGAARRGSAEWASPCHRVPRTFPDFWQG